MARVPMIFSQASAGSAGAAYTVPVGKYGVVKCIASTSGASGGSSVAINGIAVVQQSNGSDIYPATNATVVAPAGTVIQCTAVGANTAMASGFLYDL